MMFQIIQAFFVVPIYHDPFVLADNVKEGWFMTLSSKIVENDDDLNISLQKRNQEDVK